MWAAEARVARRLLERQLRRLQERLSGCEAEVVIEEEGSIVRFRLLSETLAEATAEALSRLGGELPIVGLSVMTLDELQREREQLRLPDLVGILDIPELAGLGSKQRALQVTTLPAFPPPSVQTRAGRLWTRAAVEDFLRHWPRRPGRPRKGARPDTTTTTTRQEKES